MRQATRTENRIMMEDGHFLHANKVGHVARHYYRPSFPKNTSASEPQKREASTLLVPSSVQYLVQDTAVQKPLLHL